MQSGISLTAIRLKVECILPAEELKAQEGERQPMRVIFD